MSVPSRGDGHLIQVTDPKSLEVGTVLRMINSDGSVAPFSDCIVRAVLPQAQDVRLLRPTFNGWSKRENDSPVGYEGFCATFEGVCKHFRIVTKASGAPYVMYVGQDDGPVQRAERYRSYCGANPLCLWTDYELACRMAAKALSTDPVAAVTIVRQSDRLQVAADSVLERDDLTADQAFTEFSKPETI
ncbi:MAG: hypothetical protein E6R03_13940 [Hyphomicrobiaceae bacterium]|nr:MAG: hypothetical protein E6R03_13940 [Hyphomicrobiaceae bacterium]